MAAQDDKISENRRRLFKALSAVPVVATLRPGTLGGWERGPVLAKIARRKLKVSSRSQATLGPFADVPDPANGFVLEEVRRQWCTSRCSCKEVLERSDWVPGSVPALGYSCRARSGIGRPTRYFSQQREVKGHRVSNVFKGHRELGRRKSRSKVVDATLLTDLASSSHLGRLLAHIGSWEPGGPGTTGPRRAFSRVSARE